MPRQFLHISEPCQENWHAMTATEQGRFCDRCQHAVVDFTRMSDRQVIEYMENASGSRVCGSIEQHRLEDGLLVQPTGWKPFLKAIAAGLGLTVLFSGKADAQQVKGEVNRLQPKVQPTTVRLMGDTVMQPVSIAVPESIEQNASLIEPPVLPVSASPAWKVVRVPRDLTFIGTITEKATGEPLVSAVVMLSVDRKGETIQVNGITDNLGHYYVPLKEGDGLREVAVRKEGFKNRIALPISAERAYNAALEKPLPKEITGQVLDAMTGKPVPNARVGAWFQHEGGSEKFESFAADDQGRYSIPLKPGYDLVTVRFSGYHYNAETWHTEVGQPITSNLGEAKLRPMTKAAIRRRNRRTRVAGMVSYRPVEDRWYGKISKLFTRKS